jgi:S1-C subfamily serine protease
LDAKVVFSDSLADIAVLKIPRENCAFLELLDPVNIPVGTDLAFIGFPLDYEFPIASKSVLSAKVDIPLKQGYPSRHQLVINQFVNHGNSGGPLFIASTGQVIGVVSWRPSPNYKNRMIILPKNYTPIMLAGGVDPIALSVETYNENLKYIGEISQFGIGFVPSVEYAKQFIK